MHLHCFLLQCRAPGPEVGPMTSYPVCVRACVWAQVRALSRCEDCDVFLCDSCVPAHGRSAPSAAHHVTTFSDVTHPSTAMSEITVSGCADEVEVGCREVGLKCGSHNGQMLRFYCCDCETAVCEVYANYRRLYK